MLGVFPSAALCSLSLPLMSHSSGAANSVTLAALLTAHTFPPRYLQKLQTCDILLHHQLSNARNDELYNGCIE